MIEIQNWGNIIGKTVIKYHIILQGFFLYYIEFMYIYIYIQNNGKYMLCTCMCNIIIRSILTINYSV